MMCPEGATTNGRYLLEFKRGAFYSLRAVKPYVTKRWNLLNVDPVHGDMLGLVGYFNIMLLSGFTAVTYEEMPDFKPNDYFW